MEQGPRSRHHAPVVQKVDNAIYWINNYPVVRVAWFVLSALIHWIAIYLVNSIIQPFDNQGQEIGADLEPTREKSPGQIG